MSLFEAVEAANSTPGLDTIEFDDSLHEIQLPPNELVIEDDVVIQGPGVGHLTIEASPAYRHFRINSAAASVAIRGVTLAGGSAGEGEDGGSIRSKAESLTIEDCLFLNNHAGRHGGAIFVDRGQATLRNTSFRNNSAISEGGAVWARWSLHIVSSTFESNGAGTIGGAVYSHNGPLVVTGTPVAIDGEYDSRFLGNRADKSGGAIDSRGRLEVRDSRFATNWAQQEGGAIRKTGWGSARIETSMFENNIAGEENIGGGDGGALHSDSETLVSYSAFTGNRAWHSGGGVFAAGDDHELRIDASAFLGNSANQQGGAIATWQRQVQLSRSTIEANSAVAGGGGLYIQHGHVVVSGSLFVENSSTGSDGGAVMLDRRGELTLLNSTVADNQAAGSGGGLYLKNADNTTKIVNTTLTGNRADINENGRGSGGGIYSAGAGVQAHNTIVWGNFQGGGAVAFDIAGTVNSDSSHNLIGDPNTAGGLTHGGANGNLVGLDPLLGPLDAGNGGPTATRALLAGSPAIDAGDNARAVNLDGSRLVFDQRGVPFDRINGLSVDIGAYEWQGPGGRITGKKWLQLDSNTVAAVDGLLVYLDGNSNQEYDLGETVSVLHTDDPGTPDIDETGTYRFAGLPPGTYHVREWARGGFSQVAPLSPGEHVVTITGQEEFSAKDFGNRVSGEIQGVKFDDRNGNGIRDRNLIRGQTPHVVMVLDVSNSTSSFLDDERQAMLAVRRELIELGMGHTTRVSVIVFSSTAVLMDMAPELAGFQRWTTPLADADQSGESDLEQVLQSIRTRESNSGNDTDYEEALSTAIVDVFQQLGTEPREGNLFFCSDGQGNNRWSYLDDVERLKAMGISRVAIGFGTLPDMDALRTIDPDALQFSGHTDLAIALAAQRLYGDAPTAYYVEPGIAGVAIYLDSNGNGMRDGGESWALTQADNPETRDIDELGSYRFAELAPEQYVVREEVPAGYVQTAPLLGHYSVSISADEPIATGLDFGNRITPGVIRGCKFRDLNGNGSLDVGEPGQSGVKIFLDQNGDEVWNEDEPYAWTKYDGSFEFDGIAPGEYTVREVRVPGYVQTSPADGFYRVTVLSGQTSVIPVPFLNYPHLRTLSGLKWLDENRDGVRGPDEEGMKGVRIYVDSNSNGRWDKGEPYAVTRDDDPSTEAVDEKGTWEIPNLLSGIYDIREEVPTGYQVTVPPSGLYHLEVPPPPHPISPLEFVNIRLPGAARLSGTKFLDINGNGWRDAQRLDGDDPLLVFTVDVSGSMRDPFVGEKVGDTNEDEASDTTLDAELAALIAVNQALIDQGLGDAVKISIVTFWAEGEILHLDPRTAAPGGLPDSNKIRTTTPAEDLDENGVPDIEQILLRLQQTGNVETDYKPALEKVRELLEWEQRLDHRAHVLFLSDGDPNDRKNYESIVQDLQGHDVRLNAFGIGGGALMAYLEKIDPNARFFTNPDQLATAFSFPLATPDNGFPDSVSGSSDGLWAEPGQAGVTIYLDADNNGRLDWTDRNGNGEWDDGEGERWTLTREDDPDTLGVDETGWWEFAGLPAGVYNVREVVPDYHRQTLPVQAIRNVSVSESGVLAKAPSFEPAISADGRYVAFHTKADNLHPNDTDAYTDIYVVDTLTGQLTWISQPRVPGARGDSQAAAVSADGRYVAFQSEARDLEAGDTNYVSDIYVWDRDDGPSGSIRRITHGINGMQPNGKSLAPAISADGQVVAFESDATNLVSNDSTLKRDIFLWDRNSGQIELVSVRADGTQGKEDSQRASISADGRFVAFDTKAKQMLPAGEDTNGVFDVFVVDRVTKAIDRVSTRLDGSQTLNQSRCADISSDGQSVAFWSVDPLVAPVDANELSDVFVRDRSAGTITLASRIASPVGGIATAGNHESGGPDPGNPARTVGISGDGRFIAFPSTATDLISGDHNATRDLFLFDRETQQVRRISTSASGAEGNDPSVEPSLSDDGRFIAFETASKTLVAGDRNGNRDIYLVDQIPGYSVMLRADENMEGLDFGNQPPISLRDVKYAVPEQEGIGQRLRVAEVFLADATLPGALLSVSGDGADWFELEMVDEIIHVYLTGGEDLDHETNQRLNVVIGFDANAGLAEDIQARLIIDVLDVPEPPTGLQLVPAFMTEDIDTRWEDLPVGSFVVTDQDGANDFAFEFVAGDGDADNAAFAIHGDALYVKRGAELNFEVRETYSVRVVVNDGDFQYETPLTVAVMDINEPPTDLLLDSQEILENTDTTTGPVTVGTLSTVDEDMNDLYSYSLVSGTGDQDNGRFVIAGDRLRVKQGILVDFETESAYFVRVQVHDGAHEFEKAFVVRIIDVPESLELTWETSVIRESQGEAAMMATVTRVNGDLRLPLVVTLTNGDPTEITIPATLTIPAWQSSALFRVDALDDRVLDGTQTVTIIASAPGFGDALEILEVVDDGDPYFWRNPIHPCDVNGDALISPLDVLVLVNEINLHGPRRLELPPDSTAAPPPFFDPSEDDILSASDVLKVVNFLNENGAVSLDGGSLSSMGGEGESRDGCDTLPQPVFAARSSVSARPQIAARYPAAYAWPAWMMVRDPGWEDLLSELAREDRTGVSLVDEGNCAVVT